MTTPVPFVLPTVALNTGGGIPAVGFGVYLSPPDETRRAVFTALQAGYRLLNTAVAYQNEVEVGQALSDSGMLRQDVFVTSKLWTNRWSRGGAVRGFEESLARLGTDYVDLYLLHLPFPAVFERILEAYQALQGFVADGRLRAVGVSNVSAAHLDRLIAETGVVPAVNQVELHPYFNQSALRAAHARHGIVAQTWSPISGAALYAAPDPTRQPHPLKEPAVLALAERHDRTPAQILLRWHFQNGVVSIPNSVTPERIRSNIDIFGFQLEPDEMAVIDALDTGVRLGPDPDVADLDTFDSKLAD